MNATLKDEALAILHAAQDMTIATIRPDGYPQATTVSYANDGLIIVFGTSSDAQKARNIAQNSRVSLAITLPYSHWGEIRGISMVGRAERLTDEHQVEQAGSLLLSKFEQGIAEYASGSDEGVAFFRVTPEVITVLTTGRALATPNRFRSHRPPSGKIAVPEVAGT